MSSYVTDGDEPAKALETKKAIWPQGNCTHGVLLGEEDTGKLRAAPRCHRDFKAGRHRLRDKEEDCAESECQCASPALTPHQRNSPSEVSC